MAATVRISPNISDDNLPPNLRKFKYTEKGYVFRYVCLLSEWHISVYLFFSDQDLEDTFNASRGVFTKCDCNTCSDASSCSCRDLSETYDLGGETNFSAYSKVFWSRVPWRTAERGAGSVHI